MTTFRKLEAREDPIRVGVIGAGIFGSQVIYAVENAPGMRVAAIADVEVTWSESLLADTRITVHTADGRSIGLIVSTEDDRDHAFVERLETLRRRAAEVGGV